MSIVGLLMGRMLFSLGDAEMIRGTLVNALAIMDPIKALVTQRKMPVKTIEIL